MKKIHYTLISGIAIIFAISGLGFSSLSDEIPQEIITTSPELPLYEHNLKNDYGISVAENTVATRTTLDVVKFDNMSTAKMGEKQLTLLDVRMRDNG